MKFGIYAFMILVMMFPVCAKCDCSDFISPSQTLYVQNSTVELELLNELFCFYHPYIRLEAIDINLNNQYFDDNCFIADIIVCESREKLKFYVENNFLKPLSSKHLKKLSSGFLPQVYEFLITNNELFALPFDIRFACYQASKDEWIKAGCPAFPNDLESLFCQIEQYSVNETDLTEGISLEFILRDLTEQYTAQYYHECSPVNFNTVVYRRILDFFLPYDKEI